MSQSALQTEWSGMFTKGQWHYIRPSFGAAGQDSFTQAPGQSEDLFESLLNILPPLQGNLQRRWGYSLVTSTLSPGPVTIGFGGAPTTVPAIYFDITNNARRTIWPINVAGFPSQAALNEDGTVWNPNIGVPGTSNTATQRIANSRGFAYFTNGQSGSQQKWDGSASGGVTNWGIAAGALSSTFTQPASSGVDGGGPGIVWTNPGGVVGTINGLASLTRAHTDPASNPLVVTGFGFALAPSASVVGVQVSFDYTSGADGTMSVQLLKAGVAVGTAKSVSPSSTQTFTLGGASDLWGASFVGADVDATNFGVQFIVPQAVGGSQLQFQNVQIIVTQTDGPIANPGSGGSSVSLGPNSPSSAVDLADQGNPWTTPTNVEVYDDAAFAKIHTTLGEITNTLSTTQYGFVLAPGTAITSVAVQANVKGSAVSVVPPNNQLFAQLTLGGAPIGNIYQVQIPINTLGNQDEEYSLTFPNTSPTWGVAGLTDVQVTDPTFGVNVWIQDTNSHISIDNNLDGVQISLNSNISPSQPGSLTLISGRVYFSVFANSSTGHYSDLSAPSNSTGPLTNQQVFVSNIPFSADPQVDTTVLLATADGGDETLLYFLASFPNGQTSYTDNTPDTTLVLQNVYLETDLFGNEIGVAANTPPPTNLQFPLAHRGRIYGASHQNLFFSKAESDLLTTTGFLAGKFEEAWPGLNYFTISSGAEIVNGLLSDGQVLYIGTNSRVIRLFGDGPSNYSVPEVLFTDVGVLNQEVWRMVFVEGNPLGALWLTPDYRVMGSDFNTYQDVGRPVQDVLNSINTSVAANVSWARYVSKGIYSMYMLAVPTGANLLPDTLLVFDLKLRQWFVWKLSSTPVNSLWEVTQAGVPVILFQNDAGKIYQFDPALAQDRVGDSPVNFAAVMRTSFLSLVDPTARKYLNELEIATGDPGLLVTIEGASTTAEFLAPNLVVANRPLVVKPRGEYAVFLSTAPAKDRYFRYTFTSTSQVQDLLHIHSIEGGILHRV